MYLLLATLFICFQGHDTHIIRDHVYRAEVFGEVTQSLNALELLLEKDRQNRTQIIRAMAMVKFNQPRPENHEDLMVLLRNPNALVTFAGKTYLLVGDRWLETADWIGEFFITEADASRVILQTRDGTRGDILLNEPLEGSFKGNLCFLRDAKVEDVLNFFARKADLSSFMPSELRTRLSGRYPFANWLSLLDVICRESGMDWRRISNNVVFSLGNTTSKEEAEVIRPVARKNQNVLEFIETLARRFNLELIVEVPLEELANIQVDIYTQEQSWDETLDCLAVMKGFRWSVDRSDQPKLVITREQGL